MFSMIETGGLENPERIERRSAIRRTRRIDDCFPDPGACVIGYAVFSAVAFVFGFVVRWIFF